MDELELIENITTDLKKYIPDDFQWNEGYELRLAQIVRHCVAQIKMFEGIHAGTVN